MRSLRIVGMLTLVGACGGTEVDRSSQQAGPDAAEVSDVGVTDARPDGAVAGDAPVEASTGFLTTWANAIPGVMYPYDITTDSVGGVLVAGMALGTFDAGDGERDAYWDGVLLRYRASGELDWVRTIPSDVKSPITAIAVAPDDGVVAIGVLNSDADFGNGVLHATNADPFIAKYTKDGELSWVHVLGGDGVAGASSVGVDGLGHIHVHGRYQEGLACMGLFSAAGSGFYVLQLDGEGNGLSCRSMDDGGQMAVSQNGEVWIATDRPSIKMSVSKLNASGSAQWTYEPEVDGTMRATALVTDAAGNVFVTGEYHGTVSFGDDVLESEDGWNESIFAAKVNAVGEPVWARKLAERGGFTPDDIPDPIGIDAASDLAGGAVFAGSWEHGDADFGGTVFSGGEDSSVYLGELAADGGHVWSRAIRGEGGWQHASAVHVRHNGDIVLAGYFFGAVDFEPAPLTCAGQAAFVAVLQADEGTPWSN